MTQPPTPPPTEVAGLLNITDHAERIKAAGEAIETHNAAIGEIAQIRRDSLEALAAEGLNPTEIGRRVGISRQRVTQLLAAGPRPERGLLGAGTSITVAVGGKLEKGRSDGHTQPVVSTEAMSAAEQLVDLARSYDLKPGPVEVVPPPGHINLNRPGLIVLCSPRLLPFVGQMLESDPHYGFGADDGGWYLLDRAAGRRYRSPLDEGGSCDYAYVGRLPRPDGKGTFLYLAGIHSPGTKGAAAHVEANIEPLWEQTKGRRFSQLVSVGFNPDTRQVTGVEPLTELRRHESISG